MLNQENMVLKERPKFCVLEVSYRCLLQCKMCNYWTIQEDPKEIGINNFFKFVTSLKQFVNSPFEMNISGGEPLLKEGTLDLVEFIAQQGFRFSLVTNGYLITEAIARRIADSGLNFLAISLDSLDEHVHDNIRGVKGSYQRIIKALEYFSVYRGKLQNLTLQTVIMEFNVSGILKLAQWAHDHNISLSFIAICRPNMADPDIQWYKDKRFSHLWPKEPKKVIEVIDQLIKLKNKGYRIDNPCGQLERFKVYFTNPEKFIKDTPCSLGTDFLHVNPHGDVHLCCEMDAIGNIANDGIAELWVSQKAQEIRRSIKCCKKNCASMVNCYRGPVA